jgi:curved DNA-binding protein CbpA
MERAITWYEVLGVLPGAEDDKIKRKYGERANLLRADEGPGLMRAPVS